MDKKKHLYLIFGDDEYGRRKKIEEILSSLLTPEERTHALLRISALELDETIIAKMKTLTFFASKQVVLISDGEKIKQKQHELLRAYVDTPSVHTYVILEGNNFDDKDKQYRHLKANGVFVLCRRKTTQNFESDIYATLQHEGRTITPDASQLLVERVGGSASFLQIALEKILCATHKGAEVTEEVILQVVDEFLTYTIFDLTNAMSLKKCSEVLEIFSFLLDQGTNLGELVGMMTWQLRRLLEAKNLLEKKIATQDIKARLRINAYFFESFLKQVNFFTKKELVNVIDELFLIDTKVKQGRADARLAIEMLFVGLCRNQFV
ncbi:MAG: DNA polymerase III subunit delta [Candidatus Omnitrophica bacterium]|nr:DNA polymerase III subunit delta [Candidatus Omnitrophota bacterium]